MTPDKSPAAHRMRLLERRLAPNTPLTPITPATPNSNPSDDDQPQHRPNPMSNPNPIPAPNINPDKPESVQSFASEESTPKPPPALTAPSPPGVRKQRRRNGPGGNGNGGGTSKKNNKHTPATKRRLGRVDEFFKPVSATNNPNNNKTSASPTSNLVNTPGSIGPQSGSATTTPHTKKRPISPSNTPGSSNPNNPTTTPITPASSCGGGLIKTPSPRHHGGSDMDGGNGDAYRHLRSMIDRLKKDKEVLRETTEELRAENEDLQAQVDLELPQLRQSLAEREDDVRRLSDELQAIKEINDTLRDALRDAVVQGERWRRQSREHVTNADCERLGRVVPARGGVKNPFGEAWQDGREWKQVSDDLGNVRCELDAVERRARRRKRRRVHSVQGQSCKPEDDEGTRSTGDENQDSNINSGWSNANASRDGAMEGLRLRNRVGLTNSDDRDRTGNLDTCEDDLEDDVNDDIHADEADAITARDGDGTGVAERSGGMKRQGQSGVEVDELLHVRLQSLRERETKLDARLSRLTAERELLVREVRRQSDERQSRFGTCPTLHGRYVLLDMLGRGGFSEVFRAVDLDNGSVVACKIHQLASNWAEDKKRNFIKHAMREYHIHKELRHPRVVRMLDIFEIDDNSFGTVLEYCDGCDLDAYLRERKTLCEREARAIIGQVFSGLLYLSQPGLRIIHYDLKPANILLCKGKVQITDFGLSKVMGDGETTRDGMELTSQGAGTMWYLPPECFDAASEARINSKVDVWSAGVILFQMVYGRRPFGHDQSQERIFRDKTVQKEELVFPDSPELSDEAKDFIRTCLTRRAASRPDVRQLLAHPFLASPPKS